MLRLLVSLISQRLFSFALAVSTVMGHLARSRDLLSTDGGRFVKEHLPVSKSGCFEHSKRVFPVSHFSLQSNRNN